MAHQEIKQLGDLRVTTDAMIHSIYFRKLFEGRRSVPVRVTQNRFLLNFQESLDDVYGNEKELSEDMMNTILSMLVATNERLDTNELIDQLLALGLVPKDSTEEGGKSGREKLQKFVEDLHSRIATFTIQSGLTNILVKDVLTTRSEDGWDLSDMKKVGMADVSDMVAWAQDFYGAFVTQEKGDVLTSQLAANARGNNLLNGARNLFSLFHSGTGAYVEARENYIYDELFTAMIGKKLVDTEEVLKHKMYKVTGGVLPEITFVDSLSLYMWSLNTLMGFNSDVNGQEATVSINTFVDQIVTGIGDKMPFVPSEAGIPNKNMMNEHYQIMYMMHLVNRFLDDDPGEFYGRIQNQIQANRFFEAKGMERIFNEELYCLSICFEAFRDTAFFYRHMSESEDYLFGDWKSLAPKKRRKINEFLQNHFLENEMSFQFGVDNPAFYKQQGHLMAKGGSTFSVPPMMMEPYIPDSVWSNSNFVEIESADPNEASMYRIGGGELIQGSYIDLGLPYLNNMGLKLNRLQGKTIVEPRFTFDMRISDSLLSTQLVQNMYSIYPLSKIEEVRKSDPDLAMMLERSGQLRYFLRSSELSQVMQIPIELANAIWDKGAVSTDSSAGRYFYDISGQSGLKFIVDSDVAKFYEYKELESTSAFLNAMPVVGKYPLCIYQTDRTFLYNPLPLIDEKSVIRKIEDERDINIGNSQYSNKTEVDASRKKTIGMKPKSETQKGKAAETEIKGAGSDTKYKSSEDESASEEVSPDGES